jgi:hypothetical protein
MIRVYIWLPDSHNVGHASAQILADRETEYVSWWPGHTSVFKPQRGQCLTYAQDLANERRESDHQHEFDNLDDGAAARWWREFLSKEEPQYRLSSTNCSWAVVNALKAGGADSCFPWYRLLEKYNLKSLRIPDESALVEYLMGVFKLVHNGSSLTFAIKRPLIDFADDILTTWSPRDTHNYCTLLRDGIRGDDIKFPLLGI